MVVLNKDAFLKIWPQCFIIFMAIIELIAVIVLCLTELGNVAANFWTRNVFAGGWCGLVMFIQLLFLFSAGGCSPGPVTAFYTVLVTIIGLLACAALIAFDIVFYVQPTTCLLTSSCDTNAASNTTFSYSFQQSFFSVFNSWGAFKSLDESQVKDLFQTIQLGVGGLCFILCIIYLIIYYICRNKVMELVGPTPPPQQQSNYVPPPPLQPSYYAPPPPLQPGYYAPPPQQLYYQPTVVPAWHPPPYVPQAQPGQIPWNASRRY